MIRVYALNVDGTRELLFEGVERVDAASVAFAQMIERNRRVGYWEHWAARAYADAYAHMEDADRAVTEAVEWLMLYGDA